MAGTILLFTPALWDNRVDLLNPRQRSKIALEGGAAVPLVPVIGNDAATDAARLANNVLADILAARQAGEPDFVIDARTTASETFAVAELMTARGILFPTDSQRNLTFDLYISGDAANEMQFMRHVANVTGGATPVVNVLALRATGPLDLPNQFIGTAAGFAGNTITLVAGVGTLTLNVVSTEAEIVNWRIEIRVGKLQQLARGV